MSIFLGKDSKKKKVEKPGIPRTAQQTVPYKIFYANGIMENTGSHFSKTYRLQDICFRTASDEVQEQLYTRICDALNVLSETGIEFTTFNHAIDEESFTKDYLMASKDDKYNEYRSEMNNVVLNKLRANKSIISEKYVTVTVEAEDIEDASVKFEQIDTTVESAFDGINASDQGSGRSGAVALTAEERLKVMWNLYHPFETKAPETDISSIVTRGLTSKDIIAPDGIFVSGDHMEFGDAYTESLCLSVLPTTLSTEFIASVTALPITSVISTHITAIPQADAIKLVNNQIRNISASMLDREEKAARNNQSSSLVISPQLQSAREEAIALQQYISENNQRLFRTTTVFQIYGTDKEETLRCENMLMAEARKHMCSLMKLRYQQEAGFASASIIGKNCVAIERVLTTDTAALFVPFGEMSLCQPHGIYYGKNSISNSVIMYDRRSSKNGNGLIFGSSGSGKSFAAKREITSVLLGSDAYVYVIDPDGEYSYLAEMLGGEVIKIAPGNGVHLNPFDLDINYGATDKRSHTDPLALKSDFICTFCEIIVGERYGLSPFQKTIIDRVTREIYADYISYLSTSGKTCDLDRCPTLEDFYDALLAQDAAEASNLALSLERYVSGSFDTFNGHTTLNTDSRFVVYDIRDIGKNMYELGMNVLLDNMWLKMLSNDQKGYRTWTYFDEFYLLVRNTSSAQFLQEITKRCRKFSGSITGISQDVDDLLQRAETRSIIYNSDFKLLFNQSTSNGRDQLGVLLNISDTLLKHITNAKTGHGLLCTDSVIIPFEDNYPRDTRTYKVFTTSPDDRKD